MLSIKHCILIALPDVNYGNTLDDSYCIEMFKVVLLLYAIYPFQMYTLLYVSY